MLGRASEGAGEKDLSSWIFSGSSFAPFAIPGSFVFGPDHPAVRTEPDRAKSSFRAVWSRPRSLAAANSFRKAVSSAPFTRGVVTDVTGVAGGSCAIGAGVYLAGLASCSSISVFEVKVL
jgi:hypothetical protein